MCRPDLDYRPLRCPIWLRADERRDAALRQCERLLRAPAGAMTGVDVQRGIRNAEAAAARARRNPERCEMVYRRHLAVLRGDPGQMAPWVEMTHSGTTEALPGITTMDDLIRLMTDSEGEDSGRP